MENFENTADNNREFNAKQECACDAEHMYKCPKGSKQINTKSGEEPSPDVNELNKVMEQLGELDDPDSEVSRDLPHVFTLHGFKLMGKYRSGHRFYSCKCSRGIG